MEDSVDPLHAFIDAASVPLDASHTSGGLESADALLTAHPDLAARDIHAAAILGDDEGVRRFIALDPSRATAKGGPRGWDPLTCLCFSRYLRLDRARSDGFVRAARALLDAGASANTGWYELHHQPKPEWESVLYGAAGIAHHAELTRLLLERGADPNDNETPYHAPETYDNAALRILVESGRLNGDSLETMLLRKADWHDCAGLVFLLEHGADPNRMVRSPFTALQQALRRDNALENIDALMDHGGDALLRSRSAGRSAAAIAARRGRGDVLESLSKRDVRFEPEGVERLLAACARDDGAAIEEIKRRDPEIVRDLREQGGTFLAEFAGNGNRAGVRHLLDVGVAVDASYEEGDPYFDIPPRSLAIHVAAWRASHDVVDLLIERRSPLDAADGNGRTPLMLAVRACVDSHWMRRRSPESVRALLAAGASADRVPYPSGYDEVDGLLRSRR
jgi:ankyrin repeat protein